MSPTFADPSCLFCRIGRRETPARIAFENDHVLAFHDVAPKSPTHVLVIPKVHVAALSGTTAAHAETLGACLAAVAEIARTLGLSSYRVVANDGPDAGQSVFHLHFHLMGGRSFAWPPG
ncbi:MAG TPA: histidine triad nucleotide-binding protein [Thermoanaerobaculia bacterium]|nr:histidine triad nucleotide-binding protein [Thermoanaerobaculia bacterium]